MALKETGFIFLHENENSFMDIICFTLILLILFDKFFILIFILFLYGNDAIMTNIYFIMNKTN